MTTDDALEALRALDRPLDPPAEIDERVRAGLLEELARVDVGRAAPGPSTGLPEDADVIDLTAPPGPPHTPSRWRGMVRAAAVLIVLAGLAAGVAVGLRSGQGDNVEAADDGDQPNVCLAELAAYQPVYLEYWARVDEQASGLDDVLGLLSAQESFIDGVLGRDDITTDQRLQIETLRSRLDEVDPEGFEPAAIRTAGETHDGIATLVASSEAPFGCGDVDLSWPPGS